MTRTLLSTLIAGLVLAALGASATRADVHSAVVDFGNCNFNGSTATVAAGLPIDLTNTGGFATGTYGTTLHAALTSARRRRSPSPAERRLRCPCRSRSRTSTRTSVDG
jgi:hypothetical protein